MRVPKGRSHLFVSIPFPYLPIPSIIYISIWCRVKQLLVLNPLKYSLLCIVNDSQVSWTPSPKRTSLVKNVLMTTASLVINAAAIFVSIRSGLAPWAEFVRTMVHCQLNRGICKVVIIAIAIARTLRARWDVSGWDIETVRTHALKRCCIYSTATVRWTITIRSQRF